MNCKRTFVAYFYFVGWSCFSLGMHVCTSLPNIEIHLPFGFVRIGFVKRWTPRAVNYEQVRARSFGLSD